MAPSGLDPASIAAAANPRLVIGHGVLQRELTRLGRFAVITMPEPWELLEPATRALAADVRFVENTDAAALERLLTCLPPVDAVAGLGGGSCVDAAKYIGWKRAIPVITVPSIVSVDACVTNTIAVREAGRVRYTGFVVPARVVVDLDLVRRAPPALNRAGIGDVLSIHTALFDWQLASRAGKAHADPEIVALQLELVEGLHARADAIRSVEDSAIEMLVHAYVANNAACLRAETAQPEEGSEHFWAYHAEFVAGRHFVHGELVSLGTLIMAHLQENAPTRVRDLLLRTGARFQPRELGLTREQFRRSLLELPAFVAAEGFWHTIIDERPPDAAFVQRVEATLDF